MKTIQLVHEQKKTKTVRTGFDFWFLFFGPVSNIFRGRFGDAIFAFVIYAIILIPAERFPIGTLCALVTTHVIFSLRNNNSYISSLKKKGYREIGDPVPLPKTEPSDGPEAKKLEKKGDDKVVNKAASENSSEGKTTYKITPLDKKSIIQTTTYKTGDPAHLKRDYSAAIADGLLGEKTSQDAFDLSGINNAVLGIRCSAADDDAGKLQIFVAYLGNDVAGAKWGFYCGDDGSGGSDSGYFKFTESRDQGEFDSFLLSLDGSVFHKDTVSGDDIDQPCTKDDAKYFESLNNLQSGWLEFNEDAFSFFVKSEKFCEMNQNENDCLLYASEGATTAMLASISLKLPLHQKFSADMGSDDSLGN